MKTQVKKLVKSALFGVTVLGGAMLMQSFNSSAPKLQQDEVMFGRDQDGNWHELETPAEQNLPCQLDNEVCKAVYLEGTAPITGTPSDPGFIRVEQNNGYIELP
jgi:hypothetical protein